MLLSIGAGVAVLSGQEPGALGGPARAGRGRFGGVADRAHVAHGQADQEGHRRTPADLDAEERRRAFAGVFLFTLLMITREGMETALLMGTLLFQIKAM